MRKNVYIWDFPGYTSGKEPASSAGNARDVGRSLSWEDPWEEGTATQSSILARRIPWTEDLGGLQSMRLQRV